MKPQPNTTNRSGPNHKGITVLWYECECKWKSRKRRPLLGFLTLRPGDTDREYFDKYTPAQLEYANQHAETLPCECYARFGDH